MHPKTENLRVENIQKLPARLTAPEDTYLKKALANKIHTVILAQNIVEISKSYVTIHILANRDIYLNIRSKNCHAKLRYARNATCSGLLPPRLGNMAGKSRPPPSCRYTPAHILLVLGCYLPSETKPVRYCTGATCLFLLLGC